MRRTLLVVAIRLQDIADDIGVSKVTVSKVVRGSPDVGEAMRQKILKRMRELDYRPNYQARALAGGPTYSIGLIVPDLVHPFFAEVAKGLSPVVRESGRVLLLGSSEEDPEIEQQQIDALLSRGVDALLIASCRHRWKPFATGDGKRPPCVLVDRNFPRVKLHYVGSDQYRVGVLAMEHLIAIGRKRIAHIGSEATATGRERLRAFRDKMQTSGLHVPEAFLVMRRRFEESGDHAGYEAMRQLLTHKRPPDAVFCYNDLTAVGAMAATAAAGLRIPQDIAFVGCGNFRYANYFRVPLTSVDQAAPSIGEAAGRLALELIANFPVKTRALLLEPSLIVRASSVEARL